jgi:hypothetical protein
MEPPDSPIRVLTPGVGVVFPQARAHLETYDASLVMQVKWAMSGGKLCIPQVVRHV